MGKNAASETPMLRRAPTNLPPSRRQHESVTDDYRGRSWGQYPLPGHERA